MNTVLIMAALLSPTLPTPDDTELVIENTSTFEFQPVEKHDHALLHVDFDKNGLNNLHINRILDVASDDSDSDLFTVFEITFHP